MDEDEIWVQWLSLVVAGTWGVRWYWRLSRRPRVGGVLPAIRLGAAVLPVVFLLVLFASLRRAAAGEVRDSSAYLLLFVALGGTWLVGAGIVTALLGVHVVDDGLDRNNPAAAIAAAGAMLGLGVAYAFANFGEGPTIWTTIGPAALASGACALLWLGYQLGTDSADAITIERDVASGVRFAGLTFATGLILGRAVAGDWESEEATLHDFSHHGWAALPLVALAVAFERLLRRTKGQAPALVAGVIPALLYLEVAGLVLCILGSWNGAGGGR